MAEHRPDSLVLLQEASFGLSIAPGPTADLKMASWWPVDHIRLTTPLNRAYVCIIYVVSLYIFTVTVAQVLSVIIDGFGAAENIS